MLSFPLGGYSDYHYLSKIIEIPAEVIRRINSLMFDVKDDKPEGFIIYKHELVGRGSINYQINRERVYVL